ncbi:hypothetical protein GFL85_24675 [Rhizobium laguerreae]|uniref:hypothetical protein n=1 Tax=Rhizobium laguerreae TaxID=1076926 RepID=UPI00143F450B|nr:hypothetical protein [Rhizobium laguerreae]NKM14175.1 hypothetical protein [Rhizobium laguerreae]
MNETEVLISRAETVRIHLDFLDELLSRPEMGAAEAIYASLALRFLIDALPIFARENSLSLLVPAPDLNKVPFDQALFFACGNYNIRGQRVPAHYTFREPGSQSSHRAQFERQMAQSPEILTLVDMKIGNFWQQPCLVVVGNKLSRENSIRYVANKCGGAHYEGDVSKFEKIHQLLTSVGHVLRINGDGMPAVFLEVLGSAWFLLNAPAIIDLRRALTDPN